MTTQNYYNLGMDFESNFLGVVTMTITKTENTENKES